MILTDTAQIITKPAKIVSLVPSQTSLLHYLGADESVIGITKFCIHPAEWHQNKPRIGGTKALDVEKIILMEPDLIIANKEENIKDQVEALAEKFPVWVTDVNNLEDAYLMIQDIGVMLQKQTTAHQLIESIKDSFDNLEKKDTAINTAYLIWKDPYMTIGGDTFIHDLMKRAGFINVFAHKKRYPELTIEQIKSAHCKLILLSSEPYPFQEKHLLEWKQLLPEVEVKLVDGEMFSWYGSHLLKSCAYFENLHQTLTIAK